MGIETLLPEGVNRKEQVILSEALLNDHFDAIKRAYEQAGLDPTTFPNTECPGVTTDKGEFQVSLMLTPGGGILVAHSLVMDSDEQHINEADIFMWDGLFVMSSGRLVSPTRHSLMDYHLDNDSLRSITEFIENILSAGDFVAIPEKSRTSLPQ